MSKPTYGVYIGRFQPLHIGHEHVIREALSKVDTLIVVVGSSFQARTPVNPFTFEEREKLLKAAFRHEVSIDRLIIVPLADYEPDETWATELKTLVGKTVREHMNAGSPNVMIHGTSDANIVLAGYGKDESSYYLNMFPDWGSIQLTTQHGTISASDIRHDVLRRLPRFPHDAVSAHTLEWLREFALTQEFKDLLAYKEQLVNDARTYGRGPFLAADALVTHGSKILLVTRGKAIGKGTLAMPGGFVEPGERFFTASVRELLEETGFTADQLETFLINEKIADNPNRSLRGRIVSMVYHFDLPESFTPPKVEGLDDASHAAWYEIGELDPSKFFEDHYQLIFNMV